jgi:hypothetical protein
LGGRHLTEEFWIGYSVQTDDVSQADCCNVIHSPVR